MALRRGSKVMGVNTLRRKLRRMDPAIQREVQDVVRDGLNRMQRDAMSMAPVDEGNLRASIDVKLGRDMLTGIVGPGVKAAEIVRRRTGSVFGRNIKRGKQAGEKIRLSKRNRNAYWQMLKGYWQEFGTKGTPKRNIPPQPARPFMRPAFDMNKGWIRKRIRTGINKALERASRG